MKDYEDIPNSLITASINEYVKGEKSRGILIDRLINRMCYEPLAEKYDISVSTVKRTIYKYEYKVLAEAQKEYRKAENSICEYLSVLPKELVGV